MLKKTIICQPTQDILSCIPPESLIILDFKRNRFDRQWIDLCREANRSIDRIILSCSELTDPRLTDFVSSGIPMLIQWDAPSCRDAVEHGKKFAFHHVTIEVEIRSEIELAVVKILTSLGVQSAIPIRQLGEENENLLELMEDAILPLGKRASITPFFELQKFFLRDDFEIAYIDPFENNNHVDLRENRATSPVDWDCTPISTARIPFLLSNHECAYCEGLLFCHGYFDQKQHLSCRRFFSEFIQAMDIVEGRKCQC